MRPLQVPPAHTRAFCAEVQPPLPHTGQPSSHAGNRAPWPACSPLPCIGLPSPGLWAPGPESRRGRRSPGGHGGVRPALGKSLSPGWACLELPTCRVPSAPRLLTPMTVLRRPVPRPSLPRSCSPLSLTLMTTLPRPGPGLCPGLRSLGPAVLSPRGGPLGFCFPASQRTSVLSELQGSSARTQRPGAPWPRWRYPRGALGRTQPPPPPGPAPPVLTQRGGYGLATRCAGSDPRPLTHVAGEPPSPEVALLAGGRQGQDGGRQAWGQEGALPTASPATPTASAPPGPYTRSQLKAHTLVWQPWARGARGVRSQTAGSSWHPSFPICLAGHFRKDTSQGWGAWHRGARRGLWGPGMHTGAVSHSALRRGPAWTLSFPLSLLAL